MILSREILAEHLAGMIRFQTVSKENEEEMDFMAFSGLQNYLEQTYPLVHRTFQKEIVGRAALLYHWKGKRPCEKLPLLLAAHQDVVPAGNLHAWTYPPFDGAVADGYVWGRGSLDCKSLIMGQLEALESLIAEGFEPDFDIYLAYGYNEEISSTYRDPAAKKIARALAERNVKLGMVLDEGGSIVSGSSMGVDGLVANICIAEKGYGDFRIYKEGSGGHSARPGKNSIMADVARAVVKLADNPQPYRILPEIALQYRLLSPYVLARQKIYENIELHKEEFFSLLDTDPAVAAKFQTTVALTMAEGSYRSNVMPEKVSVTINCRPLPGDTVEGLFQRFQALLSDENDVKIEFLGGRNPSSFSDSNTSLFRGLQKVIEGMYPQIKVLPSICLGGTDAYYYHSICDHVYRFSGEYRTAKNGAAHAVNERISIETIDAAPKFFYEYLPNYGLL